jgi:hypothetical protein
MMDVLICDLCDARIPPHAHYVVRIDVFADPTLPSVSGEELEQTDFDQTFAELIKQMEDMSADDLQDDVHRRFEFKLCPRCQREFLRNPLGKPRKEARGVN